MPFLNKWVASLSRQWNCFWQIEETLRYLAAVRIIAYGWLSINFLYWYSPLIEDHWHQYYSTLPPEMRIGTFVTEFFPVVKTFELLPDTVCFALIGFLFFCTIGFFTKFFQILAAVTGFLYFNNMYEFGYVGFAAPSICYSLFFMAFLPMNGVYSLDALFARNKNRDPNEFQIAWPIQLLKLQLVSVFFFSAINKLKFSGWDWAGNSNLYYHVLYSHYLRIDEIPDRMLWFF